MSRRITVALSCALAVAACGGASNADSSPGAIASVPQTSASAESRGGASDSSPTASGAVDVKSLCAKAEPVKTSAASGGQPGDLDARGKARYAQADRDERASGAAQAKTGTYSQADLEALRGRAAWEEILDHAEDVPPAQRTPAWDSIVEAAATGYITNLSSQSDAFDAIFASQALLRRYPRLSSSSGFMAKRGEAGQAAAQHCLEQAWRGQHCIDGMKAFLNAPNTDASVGFQFGKIARKNQNSYVAVPFFEWALAKKADASSCGDEDVSLAVVAGLGLPTDDANAAGARRIAQGACWNKLHDAISHELAEPDSGSYYRDNACAVLKAKGAL